MRTITKKDKRGLLVAFRRFLRAMSGERISQQAGEPLLESAIEAGITFDSILNRENWGRAKELVPDLSAADYIEMLCNHRIKVCDLAEEPNWHENENGFTVIAEAAHDFFMEVSGRGGKWNIPSALLNLAKAIRDHSLQAILSEELITRLTAQDEEMNYFNYVQAIARDFNAIDINDEPTEYQIRRLDRIAEELDAENTEAAGQQAGNAGEEEQQQPSEEKEPETVDLDDPFPEDPEEEYARTFDVDVNFIIPDPNNTKRQAVRDALDNYTPEELLSIVDTINNGRRETLNNIIDIIVDGRFDPSLEDMKASEIHRALNIDLQPSFIACVNTQQGIHVDEQTASRIDILHDSWDLRPAHMRKLYKLKMLVNESETKDPDLLEAVADIERLYTGNQE